MVWCCAPLPDKKPGQIWTSVHFLHHYSTFKSKWRFSAHIRSGLSMSAFPSKTEKACVCVRLSETGVWWQVITLKAQWSGEWRYDPTSFLSYRSDRLLWDVCRKTLNVHITLNGFRGNPGIIKRQQGHDLRIYKWSIEHEVTELMKHVFRSLKESTLWTEIRRGFHALRNGRE